VSTKYHFAHLHNGQFLSQALPSMLW